MVVFHEQVLRIVAAMTGCSLAEADEHRRTLGSPDGQLPRCASGSTPRALGRGYSAARRRAGLGGAARVRLVRLLQGPRRGLRAADLPVGLAQGAPPGGVPRRRAHPRPGHVPQAADPRRRAPARASRCSGSTSTPPTRPTGSSASGPTTSRRPEILGEHPRRAPAEPGVPDGRAYGIRLSLADVKGIDGAEIARIVAGRPYALAHRLLAPGPGLAPGRRAAGPGRRVRLPVRPVRTGSGAPPGPGDPSRPAAAGRRPRPLERAAAGRAAAGRGAGGPPGGDRRGHDRQRPRRAPGADVGDPAVLAARQSQAGAPVRPPAMQLALDLGPGRRRGRQRPAGA